MPPLCRETQSLGQQMLNAPVGIASFLDNFCYRGKTLKCCAYIPEYSKRLFFIGVNFFLANSSVIPKCPKGPVLVDVNFFLANPSDIPECPKGPVLIDVNFFLTTSEKPFADERSVFTNHFFRCIGMFQRTLMKGCRPK